MVMSKEQDRAGCIIHIIFIIVGLSVAMIIRSLFY